MPKTPIKPGRPKGVKNKRTRAVEEAVAKAQITPLEFMLQVLRDESLSLRDRVWAANASAPYVHARLSSVDLGNKDDKAFEIKVLPSDMGLL